MKTIIHDKKVDKSSRTPIRNASNFGALLQNGRGLRPYDLAAQQGQHACAEYLLTYETLCDLAADFCSLEAEAARLQTENTSYKDNFRSVPTLSFSAVAGSKLELDQVFANVL